MKMNTGKKQGFTLLEVVITSILMVVMMIPVARLGYFTLRSTQYAKDAGQALAQGERKMAELSNIPYASLASGSESSPPFTLHWTVTTSGEFKTIRLQVRWPDSRKTRTFSLATVVASDADVGYNQ